MKDKPRIGCGDVGRIQVFNGTYSATGERIGDFERPWTVFTRWDAHTFATHAEALEYALKEAGEQ